MSLFHLSPPPPLRSHVSSATRLKTSLGLLKLRQDTPEPLDGVFDPAFLPRRVDITEESRHVQFIVERVLGPVIDDQGAS